MPIHDVGYRRWDGEVSSVWLRWAVVAGAGIRLVWKSHWLRRMLIFAWLPTAVTGFGFFLYEQSLERYTVRYEISRLLDVVDLQPEDDAETGRERDTAEGVSRDVEDSQRGPQSDRQREEDAEFELVPDHPVGISRVVEDFKRDPQSARHGIWSLLLMAFFRYPQGLLMVLLVGMIAPSLIAHDMRSRAFLLYFSRPLTPLEYIFGKALVIWAYLASVTTLPALVLYILGVLLSPNLEVILYTWDLPFRILAASLVLMLPTTSLALFFSSCTTESRYAGFAWFALWGLGWAAYTILEANKLPDQWVMVSLYHMLGRVQAWVFGLHSDINDVTSAAILLIIVTVMPVIVLLSRVVAPMRV